VRQIARLTDQDLNLDCLFRTYAICGSKRRRADLLLKLAIHEHSQGRPQPVQWMKDLKENKLDPWLVYGMRPSRTTLQEFRERGGQKSWRPLADLSPNSPIPRQFTGMGFVARLC
jgi:hypothetical protein